MNPLVALRNAGRLGRVPIIDSLNVGLSHYFPLNETTGNRLDVIAPIPLQSVGATSGVGKNGNAVSLDPGAAVQYLRYITSPTPFLSTGDQSISVWANSIASGFPTGNGPILTHLVTGSAGQWLIFVEGSLSGHIGQIIFGKYKVTPPDPTGYHKTADGVWTHGAWHHLVITSKSDVIHLYLDGVEYPVTYENAVDSGQNTRFCVGNYNGLQSGNWKGLIDEIAIYDRGLSRDEALRLWNNSAGKFHPF